MIRQSKAYSADQTIKHIIIKARCDKLHVRSDFPSVIEVCEKALAEVAPLASKRGRKTETVFRLFSNRLADLVCSEGVRITLPSNENVFGKLPPFHSFVQEMIGISISKGSAAVEVSELTASEKDKAKSIPSSYAKSDHAIVHYL